MYIVREPLYFCARHCACKKYQKQRGMSIESPLLFAHGDAHIKIMRSREVRRSGAPCFLYAVLGV
jgi:hypothetical protein